MHYPAHYLRRVGLLLGFIWSMSDCGEVDESPNDTVSVMRVSSMKNQEISPNVANFSTAEKIVTTARSLSPIVGHHWGSNGWSRTPDEDASLVQIDDLRPGYIRVPGGQMHQSCVHELVQGDVVETDGVHSADGRLQRIAPCAYPTITNRLEPAGDRGWIEWAEWDSANNIGSFAQTFHVPAAPTLYTNQLVYLWPGLESMPGDAGGILQPVLQYGNNGSWGGKYWSIASWVGVGGHYYTSGHRTVMTSEQIYGRIYRSTDCNSSGCVWNVVIDDSKNLANLVASTRVDVKWNRVVGGNLESAGGAIDSCQKYPATYENFYNLLIQDRKGINLTAHWTPHINVSTCGERITTNATTVNLYY